MTAPTDLLLKLGALARWARKSERRFIRMQNLIMGGKLLIRHRNGASAMEWVEYDLAALAILILGLPRLSFSRLFSDIL